MHDLLTIDEALPRMQALASRTYTIRSRHHPGQLAWSARFAEPQDVEHGPAAVFSDGGVDVAWAWLESPTWGELCVDPSRPAAAHDAVAWLVDQGASSAMTLETETAVLDALRDAGFVEQDLPWFTHHVLDLATLDDPRGWTATGSATSSPARSRREPRRTAPPGRRRRPPRR